MFGFSNSLCTIAEICASTHSHKAEYTTLMTLHWSLSRPHAAVAAHDAPSRLCHQTNITKTAGQGASISNDNCKEVIIKYVCPGECLPPNPLLLLASF